MGNRFLMARYRASEALLYQIFMQRVLGLADLSAASCISRGYFERFFLCPVRSPYRTCPYGVTPMAIF